ncbi:MAG: DoxX family protein [Balneolales bacterium]
MNMQSPEQKKDIALLLLRIGVGIIFIIAGWSKLTGIDGVQNFFGNIGIPLPGLMAWVVGLIEFVGGLMVLLGAYIRIPAILLACVMLVAILTVKIGQEFTASRLEIMLLLVNVAFTLVGSGRFSVDDKLNKPDS